MELPRQLFCGIVGIVESGDMLTVICPQLNESSMDPDTYL